MAITHQRPAALIAERHAQELDWFGYVAGSMLRQHDPDAVALFALGAIADVVRATHACIYRVDAGRKRLVGESQEGVARKAEGHERPRIAGEDPVPLRRVRTRSDPGSVIVIDVDGVPVAEVHILRAPRVDLDATARTLLDRLVTMTGAAIRNAELVQAERARADWLAQREQAKSQLVGVAAHELRGPMTVLMGYISLLDDGALGDVPDTLRDALPKLQSRVADMDALITAMIETCRIDDGTVQLQRAAVDARELVDEAVRRCEVFARPGQLVALRCGEAPVLVNGDRVRLVTAIANLVHNAIAYSVDATDVHCCVEADAQQVRIVVRDEGVGIAAEDQPLLFTRFGRIRSNPAVHHVAGTGLGLYLARELARFHGGDISVESAVGEGSTFTLILPRTS